MYRSMQRMDLLCEFTVVYYYYYSPFLVGFFLSEHAETKLKFCHLYKKLLKTDPVFHHYFGWLLL